MSSTESPAASIILATLSPWAEMRPVVEQLLREARGVGGEVVVADGTGQPAPHDLVHAEDLRLIAAPGLGIFALRLAAMHASRGAIVIVTEDHCYVPPGWCEMIVERHRRHPEADLIKGTVVNGSLTSAIDRASFMMLQWRNIPPIDQREAARATGVNGSAFKRQALNALLKDFPGLTPEQLTPAELRSAKLTLLVDETLEVTHVQSETWWQHGLLHFHNSRALAGVRRARAGARSWLRVLAAPLLVPYRTGRVLWRNRSRADDAVVVAPGVAWLYLCKGAGESLGFLAGPGNSERKFH